MRVLITGIAGFLGINLAREYLKKGWEVHGIDDLSVGERSWLPNAVYFIKQNISKEFSLRGIRPNLVIHLASRKIPRDGNSQKGLIENTSGLLRMAKFAYRAKIKFIYLSTSDVYGKNTSWKEDSDLVMGPTDVMRWSYAVSKIWGEQLLYSMPNNFKFNIIRLFGTYGPYHALSWTAGPQSVFISQAIKKEPITIHGDGMQKRAFQYVDDAIDGIIRVAESDYKREVFNIGNPNESITIDDLSRLIWKLVNPTRMRPAINIPHSSYKYEEIPERVPDISKARELLGFEPKISLEEGLRRTIKWQKTVM